MSDKKRFILTLSCKDIVGIVATVSGFLRDNDGFIIESAQFGDFSTNRFFMRTEFEAGEKAATREAIIQKFVPIAEKFSMEWSLYDVSVKTRALIMVSKEGHCLNDILHRMRTGALNIDIPAVVSNHTDLQREVEWLGIPFFHLPVTPETKASQEQAVWQLVKELNVDVVVLARYMQVLSDDFCQKLHGRAINIHHSFLPSFKGAKPYHQAFDRGVKLIGATAHFVTGDLDEGPIIEQEVTRVDHTNKPQDLRAMGQDIESIVLSRALKYYTEHRVLLNAHKTVIFK